MGMKENFKQATWELMNSSAPGEPHEEEARPTDVFGKRPIVSGMAQRTVVASGDSLKGDLQCSGGVDLFGSMTGNISGTGDLHIFGRLKGDAAGHDVDLNGGRVLGNIRATGHVQVGGDAVIVGNIRAKELTIRGKVRGDLEIEGMLTMGESAVVLGKISVGRLSIADGAAFQGEVAIHSVELEKQFPPEGTNFPEGEKARPTEKPYGGMDDKHVPSEDEPILPEDEF